MFLINSSYYRIKETKRKGRGVFAMADIEPGAVIGDYLGVVMLTENAVKTEPMGTYYMELTKSHSVLADKDADGIHIINHSCQPNCASEDFKGHTLYVSIRKIFKGEELTVNYNFGPPDIHTCSPCRHTCHCGSKFCSGSMHTSSEKDSVIMQDYSMHSKTFENKISKLEGKMLPPLSGYPKKLPDDSFFDLFGNDKQSPTVLNSPITPSIKKMRETIRSSGRIIALPKIGLLVYGVMGDSFVSTVLK